MEEQENIEQLYQQMQDIQAQLADVKRRIEEQGGMPDGNGSARRKAEEHGSVESDHNETIIEGVFDGQNMVGPDGRVYPVPANYASKSKLVEGDIMKLTIQQDGSFLYKQIGPMDRKRITGTLVQDDETGMFQALTERGRGYRLLTASVTYYKGEPGDQVVMLVPEEGSVSWAAVENIMPTDEASEEFYDEDEDPLFLDDGTDGQLDAGFDGELT